MFFCDNEFVQCSNLWQLYHNLLIYTDYDTLQWGKRGVHIRINDTCTISTEPIKCLNYRVTQYGNRCQSVTGVLIGTRHLMKCFTVEGLTGVVPIKHVYYSCFVEISLRNNNTIIIIYTKRYAERWTLVTASTRHILSSNFKASTVKFPQSTSH